MSQRLVQVRFIKWIIFMHNISREAKYVTPLQKASIITSFSMSLSLKETRCINSARLLCVHALILSAFQASNIIMFQRKHRWIDVCNAHIMQGNERNYILYKRTSQSQNYQMKLIIHRMQHQTFIPSIRRYHKIQL